MMKQASLASAEGFNLHHKPTRKERFITQMDKLIPWDELCALIDPYYAKAGNGRPPVGLERMLRMYFIANWFNLADEACEEALQDIAVFRSFCKIDTGRERIPDATTLLKFRHLLERHNLGARIFSRISTLLQQSGLRLEGGTIVDATIIAAPSSTKNKAQERDPEMHSTKKGNQWHFGMKVHTGVDSKSGIVHSISVTPANVHDSQEIENLLHGNETRVYGDSAYTGQKEAIKQAAPHAKDFTTQRGKRNHPLTDKQKQTNQRKNKIRAKVEHPYLWLKRIWGFSKARYRGIAKNANRAFIMLALFNVHKWAAPLTPHVRPQ